MQSDWTTYAIVLDCTHFMYCIAENSRAYIMQSDADPQLSFFYDQNPIPDHSIPIPVLHCTVL
jgi:hypothetical protein